MNKKYIVDLNLDEEACLRKLITSGKHSARQITRARVLLLANEDRIDPDIAEVLHTSLPTVQRTRQRFVEGNLEYALEEQWRCGRPRKLGQDAEKRLISLARSVPPAGHKCWTTQLLADKLVEVEVMDSLSDETVRRALDDNDIKPWLKKRWCIPTAGAEFVWCMEDILDLYAEPYHPRRPVVCFDEKVYQLVAETRRSIPVQRGWPKRVDYEYQRQGTRNLFVFFQPLSGWRHVKITPQRTKTDFSYCMRDLTEEFFPHADVIRVVQDNLNTHTPAALYETFPPAEAKCILDRLEFHYTPKHSSWLNMVEIELSVLSGQCLDRYIPSETILQREIAAWEKPRNEQHATVDWRFTTADARTKLKRLYPTVP